MQANARHAFAQCRFVIFLAATCNLQQKPACVVHMRTTPYIAATAIACLVACGNADSTTDASTTRSDGAEPIINGEPASKFFGRFVWETSQTHNKGAGAFSRTNSKDTYVLNFYLNMDHSYIAYYGEGEGSVSGTEYTISYDTTTMKKLTGMWSINGTKLTLGSLVSCDGITYNDKAMLRCKLVSSPGTAAATQGSALVGPHFRTSTPSDSQWAEYL